ncbi:hypothetical protein SAMN05216436_12126 [bacterium A37T11]|nr:hypothetical protein SAMN05216436_12126 [bacterium A37T11]
MRNKAIILIFVIISLTTIVYMKINNNTTGKIEGKLDGNWMLERESDSPWNTKILPVFLFFDRNFVLTRGYGEESTLKYIFKIEDEHLMLGDKINFKIEDISDSKLVLEIKGNKYSYYRLINNVPSSALNEKSIHKMLLKYKWKLNSRQYNFIGGPGINGIENSYSLESIKDSKKFFGSYSVFNYNENQKFLMLLTDDMYQELVYKIVDIESNYILLEQADGKRDKLEVDGR